MNNEFVKDLNKTIMREQINQKLTPGSTPRRYEPEIGVKKHNERIHNESRYADHYNNLPFTFRKPPKPKGTNIYVKCDNCGEIKCCSSVTVGIVCKDCGKYSSVTEVNVND